MIKINPFELTIDTCPLPWKAPFVGTRGAFSPRHHWKEMVKGLIRNQYKAAPLTGYIQLSFTFYMPIPKATPKWRVDRMIEGIERPENGGDISNLKKLIEDCMTGLIFLDDKQVVSHGESDKFYSHNPRSVVKVIEWPRPEKRNRKCIAS